MRNVRSIRSLLLALAMLSVCAVSSAQVFLSVNFGPPALPVYEQPVCPNEGFIWVPLLGLEPGRILLGTRHVGAGSRTRPVMDARLLGL